MAWRCAVWLVCALLAFPAAAAPLTVARVVDGFERTVFGTEYGGFGFSAPYVRKFDGTVRVYIESTGRTNRSARVRSIVRSIARRVAGLKVVFVSRERDANFRIFVVDRIQYAAAVRDRVYRRPGVAVRGRCMVRAVYSRGGISRSAAVIVGNEGSRLLSRCAAEEFMQGLGPLNDDASLRDSMFNDRSGFTRPTRFDLAILNALYDRRIRIGASRADVAPVLRRVARQAIRRVR